MVPFGVVCHPHPLYGGTLDNKVVYTLARAFQQLRRAGHPLQLPRRRRAARGSYDDGRGETEDALAVIALRPRALAGRGAVAGGLLLRRRGRGARRRAARSRARLVPVAPGITRMRCRGRGAAACPWLIVQGDADDVVPPARVLDWARALSAARPAAAGAARRRAFLPRPHQRAARCGARLHAARRARR